MLKNRILTDPDSSIPYNLEVAKKVGIKAAVVLGYIQKKIKQEGIEYKGRYWLHRRTKDIQEELNFLSDKSINNMINKLYYEGFVEIDYNLDGNYLDRTRYIAPK